MNLFSRRDSFTLIELLVVLAIVAILSTVVIMTLNPAELLRQARDSNRLSDLSTLNTALAAYSADVTGGFVGTSTVVYVSVPDSSPVCANLGLPTLPTGYTYACAPTATYRKTNGTGWIPVNFSQITFGTPLSSLPVDPVNTTSSRNYYTYISGGSFEVSAGLEAAKNKLGGSNDLTSSDGGTSPSLYEVGTNKALLPIDYGDSSLVGYWNFEEGAGTTAYDHSGFNTTLAWSGTGPTRYAAGKAGSYAAQFNGTDDYISTSTGAGNVLSNIGATGQPMTVIFWASAQNQDARYAMSYAGRYLTLIAATSTTGACTFGTWGTNTACNASASSSWTQFAWTWSTSGSTGSITTFINGVQTAQRTGLASTASGNNTFILGTRFGGYALYQGLLDEFRIYNRAFSPTEITALYSGSK